MKDIENDNVRITFITTLSDLKPYAEQWNQLATIAPNQSPLMSYEWLFTYFELCSESWAVCITCSGDELIGVLPLIKTDEKRFGLSYQAISLPFNSETMSVDMLIKRPFSNDIFSIMIKHAFGFFPEAQYLHFKRIDQASDTFSHNRQCLSVVEFIENGASMSNDIPYSERKRNLPKNFRSNLNKASRIYIGCRSVIS